MEKTTLRMLTRMDLNRPTEREIQALYCYSYETALRHIHFLNKVKGQVEGNSHQSESIKDEAQSCMTRLFTPVKETGRLLILEMLKKAEKANVYQTIDIEEYLKHLIRGAVKRNRQNMMRYQQPQEYRMLRAIKNAVQTSSFYEINKQGSTPIIARKGADINLSQTIRKVELAELCKSVFSNCTRVYKLAALALNRIQLSPYRNHCLRLDHLFQIILEHLSTFFEAEQQLRISNESAELELIGETAILEPTYNYIDSIIDQQYMKKGKVDTQTCRDLKSILRQHLKDLYTTGSTESLRTYISALCKGQNEDDFIKKHRHKLYYLINLQKQHLELLAQQLLGDEEIQDANASDMENFERRA